MRMIQRAVLAGAVILAPLGSFAQDCTQDAILVFDGSGSMAEMGFNLLNEPRIHTARRAVVETMPRVAAVRRIGLITYGPGAGGECDNITLRFPPRPDAAQEIIDVIDRMVPDGNTPLARSVLHAAEVLDYRSEAGIVVLVTDGEDTCGGAPCELAAQLRAEARNLTVHVIGFRIDPAHFAYPNAPDAEQSAGVTVARCMADVTGGFYIHAQNARELAEALERTLGCRLFSGRMSRRSVS